MKLTNIIDEEYEDVSERIVLPCSFPVRTSVSEFDENWLIVEGLHSFDGSVEEVFSSVFVARDVARKKNGEPENFMRYDAIKYCEDNKMVLPSMDLLCNIVVALYDAKDKSFANTVLQQFNDYRSYNSHNVNTLVYWNNEVGSVIHYPVDADLLSENKISKVNESLNRRELLFTVKNFGGGSLLTDILQDSSKHFFIDYIRKLTGLFDPSQLISVGEYFQKSVHVWVPNKVGQVQTMRLSWFSHNSTHLDIIGAYGFEAITDAVRGVRFSNASYVCNI